jgi:uncharacterized repeat protein (TIGR03803 family)
MTKTLLAIVLSVIGTLPAEAQTYTVLHNFAGLPGDGANPGFGRLLGDSRGNLYGTTAHGGLSNDGVVFRLDSTGHETVLHSFAGSPADGSNPNSDLFPDSAGNLHGTAQFGGASNNGVLYKLDPTGKVIILYSFAGYPADGSQPAGGLVRDVAGNLYGTTEIGGAANGGVAFKLDPAGKETLLHSFAGGPADGWHANGFLIRDFAGNFYGTTLNGGASNNGAVFKLEPTGKATVLYSFSGEPGGGGAAPFGGGLVRDFAGSLYGTALDSGPSNGGAIFKLDPTGHYTVLHSFAGAPSDGANPSGSLVRDLAGNLYGTTVQGGASNLGVVFKLDSTGKVTILHSFGGLDGINPNGGLLSFAGSLYGTTVGGGTSGFGVVFRLGP